MQAERRGGDSRRSAWRGCGWGGRRLSQPASLLLECGLAHVLSNRALTCLGDLWSGMGWGMGVDQGLHRGAGHGGCRLLAPRLAACRVSGRQRAALVVMHPCRWQGRVVW